MSPYTAFLDEMLSKFGRLLDLLESLLWLPGFWTTIVGVLVGFGASCVTIWQQNRRQRKIAAMQVATNLRQWMNRTLLRHGDTVVWVESQESGGMLQTKIPDFRFEDSLEQVSLLDKKTSRKIFDLIHEKDNANDEIDSDIEFSGGDDVADIFRFRSAKLILDAWAIYSGVSRRIGWSDEVLDGSDRERMQKEITRREDAEKKRAESNAKMFADVDPAN